MGPAKPTPLITPSDGGRWMTQSSADTVGVLNYVEKVNFRRDGDVEARREGWVKFKPNATLPLGTQHLNIGEKLTLLAENIRPNSDRCIVAATPTTIYRFTYNTGLWTVIGSGFTPGSRWQSTTIDGYLILNNAVNMPQSYRVEDSAVQPVKELREVGVARVKWIVEYNGFLVCLNITNIIAAELAGILSGPDPYGLVPANKTNTISYRVIWSEFGKPLNWAPAFTATLPAPMAVIPLPYPSSIFIPGVTRVAVINGGPDGGTLGGDEAHPNGILVVAASGSSITLEVPTAPEVPTTNPTYPTYPRTVTVVRWEDQSTMSAYKDLQGDSSYIICGYVLHTMLIVYRSRGIYVGRYKADVAEPFDWKERVEETPNVPIWPEAVSVVGDDEYHLYPGRGNFFYAFDGVNPPAIHPVMDETRRRFFDGINNTSMVWTVANPVSKESWFVRPGFTLCYDHVHKTCSEMDVSIDAAAYVSRPVVSNVSAGASDEDWFILSIDGVVYTYGRVNGVALTFLRDGVSPGGRLVWGRGAFGDPRGNGDTFNEKKLRSCLLHWASNQASLAVRFKLFAAHAAQSPRVTCVDEVVTTDEGLIPVHYLATYFQDEIHIEGSGDVDLRFIGRVYERSIVRSASVTRNYA